MVNKQARVQKVIETFTSRQPMEEMQNIVFSLNLSMVHATYLKRLVFRKRWSLSNPGLAGVCSLYPPSYTSGGALALEAASNVDVEVGAW